VAALWTCISKVSTIGAPKEGAESTKAIFSLLAQLIALRTPNDLAITPAVRVTQ